MKSDHNGYIRLHGFWEVAVWRNPWPNLWSLVKKIGISILYKRMSSTVPKDSLFSHHQHHQQHQQSNNNSPLNKHLHHSIQFFEYITTGFPLRITWNRFISKTTQLNQPLTPTRLLKLNQTCLPSLFDLPPALFSAANSLSSLLWETLAEPWSLTHSSVFPSLSSPLSPTTPRCSSELEAKLSCKLLCHPRLYQYQLTISQLLPWLRCHPRLAPRCPVCLRR
jgi:hypothetical protein